MRIISSGKVGIGTASPNAQLHVVGDTTISGDVSATVYKGIYPGFEVATHAEGSGQSVGNNVQTVATSTSTKVECMSSVVVNDTGGGDGTGGETVGWITNKQSFFAPVSGFYQFSSTYRFHTPGGANAQSSASTHKLIKKNGAGDLTYIAEAANFDMTVSSSTHQWHNVSASTFLRTGDEVYVSVYHSDSVTNYIDYCSFNGFLLRGGIGGLS